MGSEGEGCMALRSTEGRWQIPNLVDIVQKLSAIGVGR
jgi:hypothetical protein